MKSPHELAMEKARQQARDRSTETWTWQGIAELFDLASDNISTDFAVGYRAGKSDERATMPHPIRVEMGSLA